MNESVSILVAGRSTVDLIMGIDQFSLSSEAPGRCWVRKLSASLNLSNSDMFFSALVFLTLCQGTQVGN